MFFAYHSGEQALVFPHTKTGKPMGIKLQTLRALGWSATDAGLRAALPRFGHSAVTIEPASKMSVLDLAAKQGLIK